MIVAIDGPAGSGKSTTARRIAAEKGWLYLDTGAMYRAVGLAFLDAGASFDDESAARLSPRIQIDLFEGPDGLIVHLNGTDVSARIRTPEVSEAASRAARLPGVRSKLVDEQRRIGQLTVERGGGAVVEGRDIGTVVFPDAPVKVFLVAADEERARRRYEQLREMGDSPIYEDVLNEIRERDRRDSERDASPLRPAEDALHLDTTVLSVEEQVNQILTIIEQHGW